MTYYQYRDAIFASNLTANQKLVALAISYHYNWKDKSPAFPSNSTLSRETSLSISTIVRAKKVLSETGWLVIQRRWDGPCDYTPCAVRATNNELNNEYNNEFNNVKIKDSSESLVIINNKNIQKVVSDSPSLAGFRAMAAEEWR